MPVTPILPNNSALPTPSREGRPPRAASPTRAGGLRPIERPVFAPTHQVPDGQLHGLQAPGAQRASGGRLSGLISRFNMSQGEKALRVYVELKRAGFFQRQNFSKDIKLSTLHRFYGHDAATSRLLETPDFSLKQICPFVTDKQVAGIRKLFIDRAYVEVADPQLVHENERQALERFFRDDKKRDSLYEKLLMPPGTDTILWNHAHCDSVFFKLSHPIYLASTTSIHVGLTRSHHPVTIKTITHPNPNTVEVQNGRELSLYGATARMQWKEGNHYKNLLLLPLASGDLAEFGEQFITGEGLSRSGHLFGARFLLHALLAELQYIHKQRGFVHNDIKPGNIFIQKQLKRPVFADFGMASALKRDGTADCHGYTPITASPEQLSRDLVRAESDVFSLGVTIVNIIIASPPFQALLNAPGREAAPVLHALFEGDRQEIKAAHADFRLWMAALKDKDLRSRLEARRGTPSLAEMERGVARFTLIFGILKRLDPKLMSVLGRMLSPNARDRLDTVDALEAAHNHCPLDRDTADNVERLFRKFKRGPLSFKEEALHLESTVLPPYKHFALA